MSTEKLTIALMGAGGKMGSRITDNLKDRDYNMKYIEVSERGAAALGPIAVELARGEGLHAHAAAAEMRLAGAK